MRIVLLIIALALLGPGDGKKKGRRGNALYQQQQYTDAALLYQEALMDVQGDGPGVVHSGLLNNLGASLFRQGEFEAAASAFTGSLRMASDPADAARANYNAGNSAAMQQQLEAALDAYRSALIIDPENEDAKYNYEFVKRQLEEQQQQQNDENQENQEQNQDQRQNQDQQQNQDENQEQQQNPDQEQQQQNQEQQEQQQQNPEELSEEEAQRIMQALENEEEQLLRQVQKMKTRPRRVEKDW